MKLFYLPLAALLAGGCVSDEEQPQDRAPSVPKQAINKGNSVELEQNLSSIRQFISMFRQENDGRAPTLEELKGMKGFVPSLLINPVDGKPLVYDEKTGTIAPEGDAAMTRSSKASTLNNSDPGAPVAPPAPAAPSSDPMAAAARAAQPPAASVETSE
ncbi:MAG TPA: hypothetical protein VF681_13160 [Abditibacteriaceae bacterium]|jgi:hypothetical protein